MNVLSLFDGMACGRLALERAGIEVDNYYASEIDKYAMQIAKKNWPDIKHIGDVTKAEGWPLPKIDLIIGGSPCQGFSFAGNHLNFDDPRSKLFFEYVRLFKECKPEWFLLENVCMKKEYQAVISEALGVEPILINSALVSAQNRKRLYWTNIPGIRQPEDRGILLEDILEYEADSCHIMSEQALERGEKRNRSKPRKMPGKTGTINTKNNSGQRSLDAGTTLIPVIKNHNQLIYKPHKSQCLDANYWKGADNHGQRTGCIELGHANLNGHDFLKRVYSPAGKCPTLTAVCGGNQERKVAIDAKHWRKLTPLECERLQTVPDGYTDAVSNTQRYKMLGNGWTIDVIAHIFDNLYLLT